MRLTSSIPGELIPLPSSGSIPELPHVAKVAAYLPDGQKWAIIESKQPGFLNQYSPFTLTLEKVFFAPRSKIFLQQYRPKADIG
jgi:hypothetical protein